MLTNIIKLFSRDTQVTFVHSDGFIRTLDVGDYLDEEEALPYMFHDRYVIGMIESLDFHHIVISIVWKD